MSASASSLPENSREELAPLVRKTSAGRTAPIDALILLALLAAANWFFGTEDPGWQRTNPPPWILLPLFLDFFEMNFPKSLCIGIGPRL